MQVGIQKSSGVYCFPTLNPGVERESEREKRERETEKEKKRESREE